jgi:hypothetical protein
VLLSAIELGFAKAGPGQLCRKQARVWPFLEIVGARLSKIAWGTSRECRSCGGHLRLWISKWVEVSTAISGG